MDIDEDNLIGNGSYKNCSYKYIWENKITYCLYILSHKGITNPNLIQFLNYLKSMFRGYITVSQFCNDSHLVDAITNVIGHLPPIEINPVRKLCLNIQNGTAYGNFVDYCAKRLLCQLANIPYKRPNAANDKRMQDYPDEMEKIENYLKTKLNGGEVDCAPEYDDKELKLLGEADFIIGTELIDVKCRVDNLGASAKDFTQLFLYAIQHYLKKGFKVKKLTIYNPKLGKEYAIDLSSWNGYDRTAAFIKRKMNEYSVFLN